MKKLDEIKKFLDLKTLAIIGVSRNPKKFGNQIYKEMKRKGYEVYPVNPNMDKFEGDVCFKNVSELPETVDGLIVNIPSEKGMDVLKEANEKGIKNVWLQQGSSSSDIVKFCSENNFNFVNDECIFMFAEPVESFHKFHKWIWKLIGKHPN